MFINIFSASDNYFLPMACHCFKLHHESPIATGKGFRAEKLEKGAFGRLQDLSNLFHPKHPRMEDSKTEEERIKRKDWDEIYDWQKIAPPRCHCPNPWNLKICHLIWQKGFCRCHEVKDLEMGHYPGLSGWAQCSHKCPYKGETGSESEKVM